MILDGLREMVRLELNNKMVTFGEVAYIWFIFPHLFK